MSRFRIPFLYFLLFSAATWWLVSDLFLPGLDEGIYLNGGHRILLGQTLYRDFFAFTGPLVYLLQGLIESIVPAKLSFARITVAGSVGLMAAGAASFTQAAAGAGAGWRTPFTASLLWWGLCFSMYVRLLVNHRWISSGAFSVVAILLLGGGIRSITVCAAAGFAMGVAVCATPSFITPLLIVGCYLFWERRHFGLGYLAGVLIPGLITLGWLLAKNALHPYFDSLAWIRANYTAANLVPFAYGFSENLDLIFVQGKMNPNFFGAMMGPILTVLSIPVVLWLWWFGKEKHLGLPFLMAIGGLITAYPRMELTQFLFISAPFFGLSIGLLFKWIKEPLHPLMQALIPFPAFYFLLGFLSLRTNSESVTTRVGVQFGLPGTANAMEKLQNLIPSGDSAFVFPYMSSMYYLLQVHNPTRYEFLQPGMMTFEDESNVLADLYRNPPRFVLWQAFPDSEILKAWPGSDPGRMRFERIERFIQIDYTKIEESASPHFLIGIWKRKN